MQSAIYCDRLNLFTCLKILHLHYVSISRVSSKDIFILDFFPENTWNRILKKIMSLNGLQIKEKYFFSGHLFTENNEAVYIAARKQTSQIALKTAETLINSSPYLKRINSRWGRNTVLLFLAKSIRAHIEKSIIRGMVTDVMAKKDGIGKAYLILHCPFYCSREMIQGIFNKLHIHFYQSMELEFIRRVASGLLKNISKRFHASQNTGHVHESNDGNLKRPDSDLPSFLILQEDDVSMDRSYRTQPHWLLPEEMNGSYRILILEVNSVKRIPVDKEELASCNVFMVAADEIEKQNLLGKNYLVSKLLITDIFRCISEILVCFSLEQITAALKTIQVLIRSSKLAQFCIQENVKAFMTCENYMRDSDAMQLIADDLGITTISYQYSNISYPWLGMQTTADLFLAFSEQYHKNFSISGINPRLIKNIGYLYDSAYCHVQHRSEALRKQIQKNGAEFIICYFDENIQIDKYGLIHALDYQEDICKLLQLVINDKTIGLIIKGQFQHNSTISQGIPEVIYLSAKSTGRFYELSHGEHRNCIFPVEAALAADITIGHAIGATASLEAAVAGIRSLIINPYGIKTNNDQLYQKAHIVFDSLDVAMDAIEKYRKRDKGYANLGDWLPIIDHFDPFRDKGASKKLREIVDTVMVEEKKILKSFHRSY